MSLTPSQNSELKSYKLMLSNKQEQERIINLKHESINLDIRLLVQDIKYLLALRDGDLQGQIEAKLNWEMLEPMEFIYNGIKVKGIYKGVYGSYGKSIKLDGVHYELKQIIKENIDNYVTNTNTST